MKSGKTATALFLASLGAVALLPRLAAVGYNVWPHGDVLLDAAIADSVLQGGGLKVPLVDIRYYPIDRFGFGYPLDQHPPLWPLLGALVGLVWRDSYEALKLLSLLCGALLLPAVWLCARALFGGGAAWFAAALCASSYLLIDFSGNGSLWTLLALLSVLFVWRAADLGGLSKRGAVTLGLIMSAGYLTNYPAIVMPLSLAGCLVVQARLRARLSTAERSPWRAGGLALGVAAIVVLPWLIYSSLTFGNPIWSQPLQRQLGGGSTLVEVVVENGQVVKRSVSSPDPLGERVRSTAANLYGNVGFLARQSLVLLPLSGGLALAGVLLFSRSIWRGEGARFAPLLVLTLTHTALILLWPTTKFRYLVPLFPLLALLAAGLLLKIEPVGVRRLLAASALGLTLFTSAWTYASIPSHTYYYDGGVVGDNFGQQGEIVYMEEQRRLERAALAVREHAGNRAERPAVLGPHPLYHMARLPLVVNSSAFSPEVVRALAQRYAIGYIVVEPGRLAFYDQAGLGGSVIWQDEHFAVYALPEVSRR